MKVKVINQRYIDYCRAYDPYAPIGMHLPHNTPSKYVYEEMTLKECLTYKAQRVKKVLSSRFAR